MKKIIVLLGIALAVCSCGKSQKEMAQNTVSPENVIKVFYFHGTQRCATCLAVESLTREVVLQSYATQVKQGKIVFQVVDFSTKEGEKIADKYEISYSSLLLVQNGKVEDLTDMAFENAKNNPDVFRAKLKQAINNHLAK